MKKQLLFVCLASFGLQSLVSAAPTTKKPLKPILKKGGFKRGRKHGKRVRFNEELNQEIEPRDYGSGNNGDEKPSNGLIAILGIAGALIVFVAYYFKGKNNQQA